MVRNLFDSFPSADSSTSTIQSVARSHVVAVVVARGLLRVNPEIAAQPDRADEVIYALRATVRFDILFAHHPWSVRNVPELRSLGGVNHQHKQEGIIVKKTMVTLACALIAPLGFAQTGTTTTEQTTTGTQPTTTTQTTTTYTAGTVTTYKPGKTIVVQTNLGAASFVLGTAARIVDGAGHIVTSALSPGQRVRVYYTGTGDTRAVEHVVVED